MLTVIVLAGGTSPEKEISKRSGTSVLHALETAGYTARLLDPAEGLDTLLPELQEADVVFPALHGAGGEDGVVQKFLEDHRITFVGSGSVASALCFDKAKFAALLDAHQVQQPKTELVDIAAFQISALRKRPFVLKPNDGGSSIDTFIVRDVTTEPKAAISEAFQRHQTMLLQELIEGVEATIAVLGDDGLPVIEIIPPANQEFDFENKYNGATQELCPPEHISETLQNKAQNIAMRVHRLTGCRDMSRTDVIITPKGEIYVLEINTIPGLTDQSLLPKTAARAGYDMPALVSRLVEAAYQRA